MTNYVAIGRHPARDVITQVKNKTAEKAFESFVNIHGRAPEYILTESELIRSRGRMGTILHDRKDLMTKNTYEWAR